MSEKKEPRFKGLTTPRPTWLLAPWVQQGTYIRHRREGILSTANHLRKFHYNKPNQMHKFRKFTPAWDSTCFRQFLCPSSGVYSLYTQQCYMLYRFVDSFRAGPEWNSWSPVLLNSCLQTCMPYTIAECAVNKLLMMDRGTARNV